MFDGMCMCPDYDSAEVFSANMVKANKEHKCCECDRVIPVGYVHERCNMKSEGSWSTYRTCRLCLAVAADFFQCGRLIPGIWDMLIDCAEPCDCDDDECTCRSIYEPPRHAIRLTALDTGWNAREEARKRLDAIR